MSTQKRKENSKKLDGKAPTKDGRKRGLTWVVELRKKKKHEQK